MSALLAGMPVSCPGTTVNRLCASGLEAVAQAARAVCSSEANLVLAGGVESMTRAPFVMGKSSAAYARTAKLEDTTMGWRFVNRTFEADYGVDSMPVTAENVHDRYGYRKSVVLEQRGSGSVDLDVSSTMTKQM